MNISLLTKQALYVGCVVGFGYQLFISTSKLFALDIVLLSAAEDVNEMKMPSVTFCRWYEPRLTDDRANISKYYSASRSLDMLVPGAYFYIGNFSINYADRRNFPLENGVTFEETWEHIWIPAYLTDIYDKDYVCFTFNPPHNMGVRANQGLLFDINIRNNFNGLYTVSDIIYVHQKGQLYPMDQRRLGSDWFVFRANRPPPYWDDSKKMHIYKYAITTYTLMHSQHHSLMIPNKYECSSEPKADLYRLCVARYIEDSMNCTLPWLSRNPQHPRTCDRLGDFYQLVNLHNTIQTTNITALLLDLDCHIPCSMDKYAVQYADSFQTQAITPCASRDDLPWDWCQKVHRIRFQARDSQITVTTEKWFYDINNFVADFGGYLGLLLGASLITLYDWLLSIGVRFRKLF